MKDIYIFKNGETVPAKIEKLFETHGPYTIEGKRLDLLTKVQLLVDSSTTSTLQSGTSTSSAKTGSMVGRAVVGGVLTGGAGAVIGGLSGKRDTVINTVSSETLHTELTAELIFEDGGSMYVLLKNIRSFHWLLGFASQPSLTSEEVEAEKLKAEEKAKEMEVEKLKALEAKSIAQLEYDNKWIHKHGYVVSLLAILAFGLYMILGILIKEPKQQPDRILEQEAVSLQSQNIGYDDKSSPALDIIGDLNKYAAGLVASTKNNISNPAVKETRSGYYVITIQTSDPGLMAEDVDKDSTAYDRNIVRTIAWGTKFCTPELKSIITKHSINLVAGELLDSKMKETQAMSLCSAS